MYVFHSTKTKLEVNKIIIPKEHNTDPALYDKNKHILVFNNDISSWNRMSVFTPYLSVIECDRDNLVELADNSAYKMLRGKVIRTMEINYESPKFIDEIIENKISKIIWVAGVKDCIPENLIDKAFYSQNIFYKSLSVFSWDMLKDRIGQLAEGITRETDNGEILLYVGYNYPPIRREIFKKLKYPEVKSAWLWDEITEEDRIRKIHDIGSPFNKMLIEFQKEVL